MTRYRLILGNKNYSSWSLRPWIAMRVKGLEFDEEVIPLFEDDHKKKVESHSSAGRVPIFYDGTQVIWDSMAILEYLAERHPDLGFWPEDVNARAHGRAICAEMHAGFAAMREECPMNLRREPAAVELTGSARGDIDRILSIWSDTRARFADGGPFLFGQFCNADAIFAPVVSRLHSYAVAVDAEPHAYMEAVMELPAFQEWKQAALGEPWVIARMEC